MRSWYSIAGGSSRRDATKSSWPAAAPTRASPAPSSRIAAPAVLPGWRPCRDRHTAKGSGAMMRSMTGFAAVTHDDARGSLSVTVRAVNHRFLDLQLRLPPLLAELEPRVRALLQRGLARGRAELQVSLQARGGPSPVVGVTAGFVAAVS